MKHTHGESVPLWKKYGLENIPPVPCDYSIGERVIYTNEYGTSFEMEVIGYSKNTNFYGRFIHLVRPNTDGHGDAYWFPIHPDELKKNKN